MEERTRRVGENEALYRQVNERITDINDVFAQVTGEFSIVCECGQLDCQERIALPADHYERIRSDAGRFILKPGHETRDLEEVVESTREYVVVLKRAGDPARHAADTHTR